MRTFLSRTAALVLVSSMSCSKVRRGNSSELAAPSDAAASGLKVGDRIVVESTTATFVEGTVIAISRDRARVQLASSGEVLEQLLSDIYVPSSNDVPPSLPVTAQPAAADARPQGDPHPLRAGSFAVCHMPDSRWRGCRIESLSTPSTSSVRVIDDDAATAELPWHEILAPTPVTELNVRQRFDRNAKRRMFREGAKLAGRPRVPSNWRPEFNQRVIAERDGAWVGAQVKGVRNGAVRLQWDSDHRVSDAAPNEVAPEPPIDFAPTVGTYVLTRPSAGAHTWSVMRVEAAGAMNLTLSDEFGDRREVATRDVVPLDRGRH
ncbi:MAG TPA: hypothetical protein VF881_16840 [Polyangiaceae bacterium]